MKISLTTLGGSGGHTWQICLTGSDLSEAMLANCRKLYFDMRNWDKILKEKNRFYLYNPFFKGDTRINLVQVWDYQEEYFPVKRQILLDKLREMSYGEIEVMNFPAYYTTAAPEYTDWYCVIARKRAADKK